MLILPTVALLPLCTATCTDVTKLVQPTLPLQAEAIADTVVGCVTLDLQLSTDRRTASVATVPGSTCGNAITIIIDTVRHTAVRVNNGSLALAVWLRNTGARALIAPAHVSLTSANAPAALAGAVTRSTQPVEAENIDSITKGLIALWRFDTVLARPPSPQVLDVGRDGAPRLLAFRIATGASHFRIVLRAMASQTPLVQIIPPDTLPSQLYADSAYKSGKALPHVLVLVFHDHATQAQRQAAIDGSGGTLIGGHRIETGEGYYYLWLPTAATEAELRAVAASLMKLPQVQGAAPLSPGHAGYLRATRALSWNHGWSSGPQFDAVALNPWARRTAR